MTSAHRVFSRAVFVMILAAGFNAAAAAQGVGGITGVVIDPSGAVLPGASVTLEASGGGATLGSTQETISDSRGVYQFLRLVPGTYTVTAAMQGFRTAQQTGLVVNADVTTRADLQLTLGTLEEGISVSAKAPLLDTTTAVKQTVVSADVLQSLPNRTNIFSMVSIIPGVVVNKIDVGGTERFLQSSMTVRGSATENKYMIDSMEISGTAGAGTTSMLYFDPYVYEEANFQVASGSAENSMGGFTVNMVTRTGTNVFHGNVMANYTPPAWAQSENYSDEVRRQLLANVPLRVLVANPDIQPQADLLKMNDFGVRAGFPIVKDKLWYSGAYSDQRMDRYILGSYDLEGHPVLDDNIMWTTSNKLAWAVTKTAQLSYLHNLQYKLVGHRGGGTFGDDRARFYNFKYPTVNQVKFTSPIGARVLVDAGYSRLIVDDAMGNRPEVKPGDVATFDSTTQFTTVALPVYNTTHQNRQQVRGSIGWFSDRHNVKAGYEYMYVLRGTKEWSMSGTRALFANGVPTAANTYLVAVSTEDATEPKNVPYFAAYRENTHGLFIQDRWTPIRQLVINLGVRYDTQGSFMDPSCRPDSPFRAGECYDKVTAPSFGDIAPRLNVVYDVFGNGRTALKFAANRYNQQLTVSMVDRINPVTTGGVPDQRQWLPQSRCNDSGVLGCDRNGDLIPQISELGPSPGYVLPGVSARYADDLKRPVSNEFVAEVQQQLPMDIVASASYVNRQTRRNIGQRNEAVPTSAWIGPMTVTEVVSGQTVQVWNRPSSASRNLFYNSSESDTDYRGLDLTLNKRMSRGWSMMSGITFGKVTSATRGGDRNDPHILSYFDADVLGAGDSPWSGRLSGVAQLPWMVLLSGTWQIQSGIPEETTVVVTNQTITLSQGNQTIRVKPMGEVRYPKLTQLDLNVRRTFTVGGRFTIVPRLEMFNLTNSATIDQWVTQLGPTYHRPSRLQRARLTKLEVSVDF